MTMPLTRDFKETVKGGVQSESHSSTIRICKDGRLFIPNLALSADCESRAYARDSSAATLPSDGSLSTNMTEAGITHRRIGFDMYISGLPGPLASGMTPVTTNPSLR